MSMTFKRLAAIGLFAAGLVLLLYPYVSEYYYTKRQQALVNEWREAFANIEAVEESTGPEQPAPLPVRQHSTENDEEPLDEQPEESEVSESAIELPEGVEGMLFIEKIELELPILTGATPQHLNQSLASVENTGVAGEVGNYAVAGHRNRTFGRNFNRLNELEEGDQIEVHNGRERFTYVVTETFLVEPHEVWVLEGNGKDKEITLITCDPLVDPTHRLIVKGTML